MGPKKVRIDPDTVYRSSTPIVQQKFPSRRRSIKSHNSAPPKLKLREQSTLTQLDWSFSTEPSSEIGDEDEDEDQDGLDRPKRKRRRRTMNDGKRQTTLTQLVGSSFEGDMDGATDGAVVDWDEQHVVRDSQSSHVDDEHVRPEEEVGQADVDLQAGRVDSARGKAQSRASPSPELPVSMPPVRTPRRRFPSEIPSSSTPQSAVLSTQKEIFRRSPEKSPLRSRSAKVWPQEYSPGKAPLSPILDTPPKPVSQFRLSPATSHPTFRVPEKPPTLQHRSTIPDSEDTATQISPPHKRKFPSQIPDTQFDLFGHEVTVDSETQYNFTCDPGGETQYNSNDFIGYDPACSALDRDAARFMQTQRLLDLRRQQASAFHFTQEATQERSRPKGTQHSPELGAESLSLTKPSAQDTDATTQSPPPPSQPQPHLPPEEEIEIVDLTESFVPQANKDMEIIRIASSVIPSSDAISSNKYPSSPPVDPLGRDPASSPPLPLPEPEHGRRPLAPSQISTVAGTQGGWLKREVLDDDDGKDGLDTSTPPLPPSTSSPPPGARRFKVLDSEDEDYEEMVVFGDRANQDDDDDDDGDLDLGVSFWDSREDGDGDGRRENEGVDENGDEDEEVGDEEEEDEDDEDEGDTTIRDLRDILPDTLLDFSLPPPPPTQSSVRSWR